MDTSSLRDVCRLSKTAYSNRMRQEMLWWLPNIEAHALEVDDDANTDKDDFSPRTWLMIICFWYEFQVTELFSSSFKAANLYSVGLRFESRWEHRPFSLWFLIIALRPSKHSPISVLIHHAQSLSLVSPRKCRLHCRRFVDPLHLQDEVTSQPEALCNWPSVSPSWRRAPFGTRDQILISCHTVAVLFWREDGPVCCLSCVSYLSLYRRERCTIYHVCNIYIMYKASCLSRFCKADYVVSVPLCFITTA